MTSSSKLHVIGEYSFLFLMAQKKNRRRVVRVIVKNKVAFFLHRVDAAETSLSVRAGASASPWDPVQSNSAPNGAHAVTGGSVAAGGIDDEFDLLSSRSKSPPTTAAASSGSSNICLLTRSLFGLLYFLHHLNLPVKSI